MQIRYLMITIFLVLIYGCADPIDYESSRIVDLPVNTQPSAGEDHAAGPAQTQQEAATDTEKTDQDATEAEIGEEAISSESKTQIEPSKDEDQETIPGHMEVIHPESDPVKLVETYQKYITLAVHGDEEMYAKAYGLISSWAKRTTGWAAGLENFRQFADVTINKYGNGGIVRDFSSLEEFGRGYRVYFNSDQGKIYYYVEKEEGAYAISSCSAKGCIYWTLS